MMKQTIIIFLIIAFAAHVGCTHTVNVTDAEWEENDSKFGPPKSYRDGELIYSGDYIFYMTDGSTLSPSRFTRTDSTFVVIEVYEEVSHIELDEPITLRLDEVDHIEKITAKGWPTTVVVAAIAGGILFLGFMTFLLSE